MTDELVHPNLVTPLTAEERELLQQCAATISSGFPVFLDVGAALMTVNEKRLYREEAKTFGDWTEQRYGWSRQRAYQLMDAAKVSTTLTEAGLPAPENERQARDLKVVQELEPETVQAVAAYIKASTGTDKPTISQIKAAAEVAIAIDQHGTVAHPDTGEEVPFSSLTGEQRATAIAENVTNGTYERIKRQEQHIQTKQQSSAAPNWADWCLNYVEQQMTDNQVLRIEIRPVPGASPAVKALVVSEEGTVIAQGEEARYLKKAVLNLIEEVKG